MYKTGFAFALCAVVALTFAATLKSEDYTPKVAEASKEGEQAIGSFAVKPGFEMRLFAAEPLVANPVALSIDERGRVFVAETFRQKNAVIDNRDYMFWLDDDLAAMTVADRLAYHQKHLKDKLAGFTKEHDRIRLVEDRDGDARADAATVFTTGYNEVVDGTGAGVLARHGTVWYTNIPRLYKLRDTTGDGQADEKIALHEGYGVRVAFRGHDLHGLRFGPDGRLYFSIGDRGFNIQTEDRHFVYPEQGAVFRCEPDGAHLEVVHTGLRNPQELAFDEYGNLFTGDNNSDSGDKARWVQIVDGGESGWRMSFQYLPDRGPWNREKLWHPQWDGQSAAIVPPITNLADGPSGLTYDPGVGLPESLQRHFFLCDFRGTPGVSGIRSFALKAKGASFEVVDSQEFLWKILATDADFGPDCRLYVTDWVEGWDGPGKGRVYDLGHTESLKSPVVEHVKTLLAGDWSKRTPEELAGLLGHPHQQVRQEAQFALAAGGTAHVDVLIGVAKTAGPELARIHAVWALGQIARSTPDVAPRIGQAFNELLADAALEPELAAQVLKVACEAPRVVAWPAVAPHLKHESPRVRFYAAYAAGKVGGPAAIPELAELLRTNADADPYLRHAAVMGLFYACNTAENRYAEPVGNVALLKDIAGDASPAVRMGVLQVLRRYGSPEVSRYLSDTEPRLVEEAARAINDVPIAAALPALAAIAGRSNLTDPTIDRVINANFRLGGAKHAIAIAEIAARPEVAEPLRIEGLRALGDWAKPSGRDRVMGLWRPLPERSAEAATAAFKANLGGMFTGTDNVRKTAAEIAAKLDVKEVVPVLIALVNETKQSAPLRVQALQALWTFPQGRDEKILTAALESDVPLLRAAARTILAKQDAPAALKSLDAALQQGDLREQQQALATLAEMKSAEANALLGRELERLEQGQLPEGLQLDAITAAERVASDDLKARLTRINENRKPQDSIGQFREALHGGDSERGGTIFRENARVSCLRCHKVAGQGGEVGPDLSKLGSQQKREYILEALVDPNRQIAKGFDTVVLLLDTGKTLSGILKARTPTHVQLMTSEGQLVSVETAHIEEEAKGKSAMPEDVSKKLSRFEIRDLVEFLSQQK